MKFNNNFSVSIGIPTYVANRGLVSTMKSLFNQDNSLISEYIIAVDGNKVAKSVTKEIAHKKLKIVSYKKRIGQAGMLNRLFKSTKSDLLIVVNDDVIAQHNSISKIIASYKKTKSDLICGVINPIQTEKILDSILYMSTYFRDEALLHHGPLSNYLSCNGRMMGLSKNMYSKIKIPNDIWNNDAYIFLFNRINGLKMSYIKSNLCLYKNPSSIVGHFMQSFKFQYSQEENSKYYSIKMIKKYYGKKTFRSFKIFYKCLKKYPVNTSLYLLVLFFSRILYPLYREFKLLAIKSSYWDTDYSTKKL